MVCDLAFRALHRGLLARTYGWNTPSIRGAGNIVKPVAPSFRVYPGTRLQRLGPVIKCGRQPHLEVLQDIAKGRSGGVLGFRTVAAYVW
eukprot:5980048-Alexandrium_andersonii.AAC.1